MRTTIDSDEDVLLTVKERARRERRSAGAVLSELARAALVGPPARADEPGAAELLRAATERSDHEQWPCDLSVLDSEVIDTRLLHGPRQITDVYLLALAATRGGRLVPFDREIPASTVRVASPEHLLVL